MWESIWPRAGKVKRVVIIKKSDEILADGNLRKLLNKVEEQIAESGSRPHVKVIIR